MFVYKMFVHTILKSLAIRRISKTLDNSGHELFIFKILLIAIDWNF